MSKKYPKGRPLLFSSLEKIPCSRGATPVDFDKIMGHVGFVLEHCYDSPSVANDIWVARFRNLLSSVLKSLGFLHKEKHLENITVDALCGYLSFEHVHALSQSDLLPENLKTDLRSYLRSLPFYVGGHGAFAQCPHTKEMHEYCEMYAKQCLHSFAHDQAQNL